jgi:hypothetical protein
MVLRKALADAQVNPALSTDVAGLGAALGADAAPRTAPVFSRENRVMLLGQRDRSVSSSTCLHRLPIGSEQLDQRAHELLSEVELRVGMPLGNGGLSMAARRGRNGNSMDVQLIERRCAAVASERPGLLHLLLQRATDAAA